MIKPSCFKKKLEGKSQSLLLTCSDGNDYVVKDMLPGFEKSLANEWIGYCIGRFLGLPIPFAQIIETPSDFFKDQPTIEMPHSPHQFASLYVPLCQNGHEVGKLKEISNASCLAGIIVFDYWLYNRDRTRKNILFQEDGSAHSVIIIDHAEIFNSYNWHKDDLKKLPTGMIKSATHQFIHSFVPDKKMYDEFLENIQSMPIHLLQEIVDVIPEEWNVSAEEKEEIVKALIKRRKKLPQIIKRFLKNSDLQ
ncbi:HipA family kinase [Niallia nealsonii]|uniref:HipA-like kinase domain-containing protein n=1 Tax=Niallia nealsonii TaxID=115979 RepID=A0A2N0Z4C5_9BACI|nr:HipA family kinase [Niallia nealsonii]PKG24344.1 hypothetical protein CWS01_06925 [Niallia nealsonii]